MSLSKEIEKLADLEFEFNIARLSGQNEDIIKLTKGKYKKQLNKVIKLSKISSDSQKS